MLRPIGVERVEAEITGIDLARREVLCAGRSPFPYDRLVFALGSRLARPPIPGLDAHSFDVDTYEAGCRLDAHVAALSSREASPGRLYRAGDRRRPDRDRSRGRDAGQAARRDRRPSGRPRVILADRQPWIGSDMGEAARAVIAEALAALGVETLQGVSVAAVDAEGTTLSSGERIDAATVVWCAGMQAHPLAELFRVERDRLGRVPVDEFLKVRGMTAEFATGDAAWFAIDGDHSCVMSCQHGRPMGRFAGHNVVCDLLGLPMLPLKIDWYTTILDLGPWGAVCTEGWDRRVATTGLAAKRTKAGINRVRILSAAIRRSPRRSSRRRRRASRPRPRFFASAQMHTQDFTQAVMAGLVPAIHELRQKVCRFPWIPGTRPGMTNVAGPFYLNAPER